MGKNAYICLHKFCALLIVRLASIHETNRIIGKKTLLFLFASVTNRILHHSTKYFSTLNWLNAEPRTPFYGDVELECLWLWWLLPAAGCRNNDANVCWKRPNGFDERQWNISTTEWKTAWMCEIVMQMDWIELERPIKNSPNLHFYIWIECFVRQKSFVQRFLNDVSQTQTFHSNQKYSVNMAFCWVFMNVTSFEKV